MQFWIDSNPNDQQFGNQHTFQKAVIESGAVGKILPLRYFPNGKLFFENMALDDRNYVTLIHNNFIKGNKIQML